jgi:cell division protein FtsI (penicillin-binding protein 3)
MTTRVRGRPPAPHGFVRRPPVDPAAASRSHRRQRRAYAGDHPNSSRAGGSRRRPQYVASAMARRRLWVVVVAMAMVFCLVGVRLVQIQAVERDQYRQLGVDQRIHAVTVAADRGSIVDRNGNDLAISVQRSSIWANPSVISNPNGYARRLAPILGFDTSELSVMLGNKSRQFVYLARQVEKPVARRVRHLELRGIGFVAEAKRYYPAGPLAASLLGWVGTDNKGLGGLEYGSNRTLAGKAGRMEVEEDPQGNELPDGEHQVRPTTPGVDLVLTIDESLQFQAERVLAQDVQKNKAKGGIAIIADVRTGDVLAMATVDGATDDAPAQPAGHNERNRPLTDVFEPGSTNKAITIASALEAGLVSPTTVLNVPQKIVVDGKVYADVHTHPTAMTVADIVRESSNVGTILIARMLGKDRFDAALRSFGFGSTTGLDYPGEAPGILLPPDQYNSTSMASMPVGNGIAVTAMQMLDVYLTLANDGVSRAPRLVAATVDSDGHRHESPLGATRRVVSSDTARKMWTMLQAVVTGGTGVKAQIPGYSVAGKTGTARKPPYEKPPYRYVASFAGFAPAQSPRLAAIVVMDEPRTSTNGGDVSAPAFAAIMQYALAVERVPAA